MRGQNEITNSADVIDSRDVIDRIACLEDTEDEGERAELAALKALDEEASGYAEDWQHGATLIRDSYFETYAREMADDIGAINDEDEWPCTCIDWERAARELQRDYMSVEFDGVTYWVR